MAANTGQGNMQVCPMSIAADAEFVPPTRGCVTDNAASAFGCGCHNMKNVA